MEIPGITTSDAIRYAERARRGRQARRAVTVLTAITCAVTFGYACSATDLFDNGEGSGPRNLGLEETEECFRGTIEVQGFDLGDLPKEDVADQGDPSVAGFVVGCALREGLDPESAAVEGLIQRLYDEGHPVAVTIGG